MCLFVLWDDCCTTSIHFISHSPLDHAYSPPCYSLLPPSYISLVYHITICCILLWIILFVNKKRALYHYNSSFPHTFTNKPHPNKKTHLVSFNESLLDICFATRFTRYKIFAYAGCVLPLKIESWTADDIHNKELWEFHCQLKCPPNIQGSYLSFWWQRNGLVLGLMVKIIQVWKWKRLKGYYTLSRCH